MRCERCGKEIEGRCFEKEHVLYCEDCFFEYAVNTGENLLGWKPRSRSDSLKLIRAIDVAVFKGWYFVYVDGLKFKRSKNFLKLKNMIKKLRSLFRMRIESNRRDFTDVIYNEYGGADYLLCLKVFDKGYAFNIVGIGVGCISPLYRDYDKMFMDIEKYFNKNEMREL